MHRSNFSASPKLGGAKITRARCQVAAPTLGFSEGDRRRVWCDRSYHWTLSVAQSEQLIQTEIRKVVGCAIVPVAWGPKASGLCCTAGRLELGMSWSALKPNKIRFNEGNLSAWASDGEGRLGRVNSVRMRMT